MSAPKPTYAIQMVDLQRQYQSLKKEIDSAILEVLEEGRFVKGPKIGQFEQKLSNYLQIEHVIGCANGTDALQIALMALNPEPGDEVITSDFSFISSAEVIVLMGLTPVLADIDENTFCIDPTSMADLISPRTKAIIPVHLFGQVSEMESILNISENHGIPVIEDNAQAIGAVYHFKNGHTAAAGSMGTIGTTSFFPSKNLGCYGDGGALFTRNELLARKMRMIANHGQSEHYLHDIIGLNSRLDTLQAAILGVKLSYLDVFNAKRQEIANNYTTALNQTPEIQTPMIHSNSSHVFHQYTLKVNPELRDGLKGYLAEQNIPSAIYYQTPLHRQKALSGHIKPGGEYLTTEKICRSVLSLPISPDLDKEQQEYIIYHIKNFIQHKS